jgi:hypothetical protein
VLDAYVLASVGKLIVDEQLARAASELHAYFFGVIVFVDGASVSVPCLCSVTASLKHGSRHHKLLQHCEAIGGAGPVYLVFVVPRHIESTFGAQSYFTQTNSVHGNVSAVIKARAV